LEPFLWLHIQQNQLEYIFWKAWESG
jgi:hypothetical protein